MTDATVPGPAPGTVTAIEQQQLDDSLRWIMRNGVGIQIMETLAVGAFLTAFALQLGANNLFIGLLAAVPHLSQLAQLPGVWLVDKSRERRKIYLRAGMVARPMMLVIALVAFLPDGPIALGVLLLAFTLRYVAGAILAVAWNSWMRDLVPDSQMGKVFGNRQQLMIIIGALVSLVAAGFVDLWKVYAPYPATFGYSIMYALSFLFGAYAVWCARHIVEPKLVPPEDDLHLLDRLMAPLADRNFKRLLKFMASWSFAVNLAAPFFAVMMLKGMGMSLTWVVFLSTLSQVAGFLTVRVWGTAADRITNKAVLAFCGPLFIACIFAWTFVPYDPGHWATIPLLAAIHVFTGIASAGVSLAGGNITLKLAPKGDATAYLASSSVVNAAAAGIAAVLGGLTADFFAVRELSLVMHWQSPDRVLDINTLHFSSWDFFFALATLIGLYSIHRLGYVEEQGQGHARDRAVVDVLSTMARRGVRNLSTVAGLRVLTEFPMELFRRALRRDRSKDDDEGG
jgi:MFS family permease